MERARKVEELLRGLERWRRDIDWLEEILREWQMNERSERQEKRERIGEEGERKNGRLVKAGVKRDERQKEVRRGRHKMDSNEREKKRDIEEEVGAVGEKDKGERGE